MKRVDRNVLGATRGDGNGLLGTPIFSLKTFLANFLYIRCHNLIMPQPSDTAILPKDLPRLT